MGHRNGRQVKMGLLEIPFAHPMKVVGIGFKALETASTEWRHDNPDFVTVAPVQAKVKYQTYNSNTPVGEWTGTKSDGGRLQFRGPSTAESEVAHDLDIRNCKSLQIEALDLCTFSGSLAHVRARSETDRRYTGGSCFQVFVYGSPEPREEQEEEEEKKLPSGNAWIKNVGEYDLTVVRLQEAETVVPGLRHCGSSGWKRWRRDSVYRGKVDCDTDFFIRGQEG